MQVYIYLYATSILINIVSVIMNVIVSTILKHRFRTSCEACMSVSFSRFSPTHGHNRLFTPQLGHENPSKPNMTESHM